MLDSIVYRTNLLYEGLLGSYIRSGTLKQNVKHIFTSQQFQISASIRVFKYTYSTVSNKVHIALVRVFMCECLVTTWHTHLKRKLVGYVGALGAF
jgi:hypothetical protein